MLTVNVLGGDFVGPIKPIGRLEKRNLLKKLLQNGAVAVS